MNRLKFGLLVVVFSIYHQFNAQDFGFNGKKNTFSFFSTGGIRVFPLIMGFSDIGGGSSTIQTIKYNSSNQMKQRPVLVRYDLRFSYTRLLNSTFGIGAEFGYEKFSIPLINYDQYSDEFSNYSSKASQSTPVFNVFSYMLVLEFHSKKGAAPIGFSSSIGVGPKFYSFDYNQNYRYTQSTEMKNPYPANASDIVAVNFFYQMNYKKVLNKFMTFDVGMRFHTGIVLPTFKYSPLTSTAYTESGLRSELFAHNLGSLVSLRAGFSFLL